MKAACWPKDRWIMCRTIRASSRSTSDAECIRTFATQMLTVSNLNQFYGGSHILRNLTFEAPAGKVTALLGRNGVGKSTLLRTLMGLVPAKSGKVTLEGRNLTAAPAYDRAR